MTPEAVVEFAEGLARIAASGGGPTALTAFLAQRTGAGVLLEDARWHHLAAAGPGPIPATARATVDGNPPGATSRVMVGNKHVGWLSLFGNEARNASLFLRLTAAAIGAELARNGAVSLGRKDDFWEALLSERLGDAAAAREEAAAAGVALAPSYVTVVLEAETLGETRTAADASQLRAIAADTFRAGDGEIGFRQRGSALFLFVPAPRAVDASNAKTAAGLLPKSAARRKPALRVCGGVGTVVPFSSVARSAAAAQSALAIGRRVYGGGHVVAYDDLGAYPILYEGATVERLKAFAVATLAPLRHYDEKHQTELERTLRLYFHVGQNVKTAAAALNVHRHTVFYRLRQIADIAGRSLESPHDQLALRTAVAVDALHGAT